MSIKQGADVLLFDLAQLNWSSMYITLKSRQSKKVLVIAKKFTLNLLAIYTPISY